MSKRKRYTILWDSFDNVHEAQRAASRLSVLRCKDGASPDAHYLHNRYTGKWEVRFRADCDLSEYLQGLGETDRIHWYEDRSGYVVYENTQTREKVRVWGDDLAAIAFVCQNWHGGQWSGCYRMMSGDYSYENLTRTLYELERDLKEAGEREDIDEDDYLDLATAVEDLSGIVARIAKIAEED